MASGETGAPDDSQLSAAITAAQGQMLKRFDGVEYAAVRDYTGSDTDLLEKKDRFQNAESCYAISALTLTLGSQQLAKSGLIKNRKTGQSETSYASGEESRSIRDTWDARAADWLSPYLANIIADSDGEQIGVRTKDRKLSIVGI
jgi:hypothetical protein